MSADDKIKKDFEIIREFWEANPDLKPNEECTLENYKKSRNEKLILSDIGTKLDPLIIEVFKRKYGNIEDDKFRDIVNNSNALHSCMNIIGNLLEEYLASKMTDGWIWCAGESVKNTDFIKKNTDGTFLALQVKNRENTENSAASKVRVGTDIIKWHRFISRSGNTRWDKFPDDELKKIISEKEFVKFVQEYKFNA